LGIRQVGCAKTESNVTSTGKPGHFDQAYPITHKAVSLVLPDLQPSLTCDYTEVFGPTSFSGRSSHRDISVTDLSGSCSELIKLAGASSVQDIYHPDPAVIRIDKQLRSVGILPSPGGFNGCQIQGLSVAEQLALYTCASGHLTWYDTYKTTSLSLSVLSVPDRKELLRVPLPLKAAQVAILVTNSGKDYLAILEDGVNLIVYRL
jgi:hypothetical protein